MYSLTLHARSIFLSGMPGETVSYTLRLTNMGNITDTFAITVTGQTWSLHLPDSTGPVSPHTMSDIELAVVIPADAITNSTDTGIITIASQNDVYSSITAIVTTRARGPVSPVFMPIIFKE